MSDSKQNNFIDNLIGLRVSPRRLKALYSRGKGSIMTEKHLYTNRLAKQKSAYLLQHAHNPVDWYPWGEEAFNAAQELDRPIFLSIGYATCHWCHVMERESFENVEIARMMNETFICIKIDREELPEIDSIYMEFAQSMMAGAAGWPLNVILTQTLHPFFASTYLPSHTSHGVIGLEELITRIYDVWHSEERDRVEMQALSLVEAFSQNIHLSGEELPSKELLDETADFFFKIADPIYGGIKGSPKFPIGYHINFMLMYFAVRKESRALFLVERTLEMMHRGGIYDHLGGGFSRYSVDETWFLPHFEKMLYDNALLADAYFQAWLITKRPLYRQVAEEVIDYVLRDMRDPEGGFYSAEDADSEGHEGFFYTWPMEEILSVLKSQESQLFCQFYDISQRGNFEGRNILHMTSSLEEFARNKGIGFEDLQILFSLQKQLLFKIRNQRTHPLKDDKILSSWNGLMIHSLVQAGCSFKNETYLLAAESAANFIKENLWQDDVLQRRWCRGEALYPAGLDEYAYMIRGLISLFEADRGTKWLEWAIKLSALLHARFKSDKGAYYQTDGRDQNLILRKCQFLDGAEPSGNAVHCENLLRLYQLTSDRKFLEDSEDILKAVKMEIDQYSPSCCFHLMNLNRYYHKQNLTIVVTLNQAEEHKEAIAELIYSRFIPFKAIIWHRPEDRMLLELIPSLASRIPIENKTTLYLCYEGACKKPLTNLSDMQDAISVL